jgi:glycosyltransferase involved in cell wall biosynthesis
MDLARHFAAPMVFEVRDLWPQALINLGVLRNPLVIHWMRRMEKKIYRAAEHIVALSPGMKAGIIATQVVKDTDVTVIPNASDLDLFDPTLDRRFGRERLGLKDEVAAIYFGGMGVANGLEYAIQAAKLLQDKGNTRIVIVLHGGGGRKADHQRHVEQLGLRNVRFSDPVPDKSVVAKLVAACDICLTIYRASKEHTWSPNKMFDAMAAGRPIIINVPGWLGETVEQNGCGFSVDPEDPAALARALEQLAASPDLRESMGVKSRAVAEREFSREILAGKLEHVLQQAVNDFASTDSAARVGGRRQTAG